VAHVADTSEAEIETVDVELLASLELEVELAASVEVLTVVESEVDSVEGNSVAEVVVGGSVGVDSDTVSVDETEVVPVVVLSGAATSTNCHAVNRLPAPQLSPVFPKHGMLQSSRGAGPLSPWVSCPHQHSPEDSVPASLNPSRSHVAVHPALVIFVDPPRTSSAWPAGKARPP
jgi:hypothetical protein